MKARLIVAALCVVMLATGGAWAGDVVEASNVGAPGTVAAVAVSSAIASQETIQPWIHKDMPKKVSARLEAGFELAVERVRDVESCRDLFAQLDADAFEILATGLYFPVDSYRREVEVCGRNTNANWAGANNLAYTKVGAAPTWLCRHFGRVSTETAAVAVIHEALHHAGLTEAPHDRLAMSSIEITEMVEDACGF
jgi:hypothetical protein